MSHFTVAVIHHPDQSVDDLLEPYTENESIYSTFVDMTDELKGKYETETRRKYYRPDRSEINPYSDDIDCYSVLVPAEQWNQMDDDYKKHLHRSKSIGEESYISIFVPENFGIKVSDVQMKELYSFDEYATDYCGYEKRGDKYGYVGNPNAKWDWYVIGGRWNGLLKLKDGADGARGEDGVMGWNYDDEGFAEARICDIDFSPDKDKYDKAKRFWEVYVEKQPLKDDEDKKNFWSLYTEDYYKEYYDGIEDYAESCAAFRTWAVLTPDGEWHEPGEMGWFGMDTSTAHDMKVWRMDFMNFFEDANPEDILTIVDCHI